MSEFTEVVRLLQECEREHRRALRDCVVLESEIRAAVRLAKSGHNDVALRGLADFVADRDRVMSTGNQRVT